MNLPCCRIEQVRASDDIGHALFPIVHHDRKLIGKEPVGAQDYKIPTVILHILHLQTLHPIDKSDRFVGRSHAPGSRRFSAQTCAAGPPISFARMFSIASAWINVSCCA